MTGYPAQAGGGHHSSAGRSPAPRAAGCPAAAPFPVQASGGDGGLAAYLAPLVTGPLLPLAVYASAARRPRLRQHAARA